MISKRLFSGQWVLVVLSTFVISHSSFCAERPWNEDIIYFALTDRFLDGDPANNIPAGSDPGLYDKTQTEITKYHGGDLRGLELALQRGYFQKLGITAIWITPPVRNVWNSEHDLGGSKTGYHGYWAQDFLDIDPHLTSSKSLDGARDYPDTRDGRMQHYKDFVALAHGQGIKVIQDIVCNHAGPVFYYDADGDGTFDVGDDKEWIQPFKRDGFHGNAAWANRPEWNQRQAAPDGPQTILGREVKTTGVLSKLDTYGRKGFSSGSLGASDGEEMECDFFALRDFWTAPSSAHFDALVDEFVEIYAFYLEEIGVDGLRIDTVKHVQHAFWDAFTERLRKRLGPERARRLLLFGEVYDGNPQVVGRYTYRVDYPERKDPSIDSLLNFPLCYAVRDFLRPFVGPYGKAKAVDKAFRQLGDRDDAKRPFFNPTAGLDGLDSQQKAISFVENHDGLNRFRVPPISERQNLLAQGLLLTGGGIPCLYYGTESGLEDSRGKVGQDSETGRLTYIPAGRVERLNALQQSANFRALAALAAVRRQFPALTSGELGTIWVDSDESMADDGVFAFARYLPKDKDPELAATVVVVINASQKERTTGITGHVMRLVSRNGRPLLREGDQLQRVTIEGMDIGNAPPPVTVAWHNGIPQVELILAPQTVNIYRIAPKR